MKAKELFGFGPFRLDPSEQSLRRSGEPVPLTPKAFEMLVLLVRKRGCLVDKRELIEALWPDSVVEEANLTNTIWMLRKALGEAENGQPYVETIPKRGYRFIADVREVREEGPGAPQPPGQSTAVFSPAKAPGSSSRSRLALLLMGLVAVATALAAYWISGIAGRPERPAVGPMARSLAVLPFKPLVKSSSDGALELGMVEALIVRLSKLRQIDVRPLSVVRRYTDLGQDPVAAGRALGADAVLDGTVQREGARLRVTVRLLSVTDGSSLWADSFDAQFTDIFAVQDSISERLAAALAIRLDSEKRKQLTKRYTVSTTAYEAYLNGRYHWNRRTPEAIRRGISFFEKAIASDPGYALAFASLADAYVILPIASDVPPNDAFPKARAAALRALELDDTLAEAHTALGGLRAYEWDWPGAEAAYRRALELDPSYAYAHYRYAHLLSHVGRHREALAEAEKARALDPLSLIINALSGEFYYHDGQYDQAIAQLQKTLEIDQSFWVAHIMLAKAYERKARYGEALAEIDKARDLSGANTETVSLAGYVLAATGRRAEARSTVAELRARSRKAYVPPYNIALVYAGLGDADETIAWLEKAYVDRDVRLPLLKVDPKWDVFRTDPRFQALERRMGFTP